MAPGTVWNDGIATFGSIHPHPLASGRPPKFSALLGNADLLPVGALV